MTPLHSAALVSRPEEIYICVANLQTAYINCWQSTVAQEHYMLASMFLLKLVRHI